MGFRGLEKIYNVRREQAIRRFQKQKRKNMLARPGSNEFVIILDNLKVHYNIGKIFRSADAFGACEIHLLGTDFFDPAPAKGSFKWVPASFHSDFSACYNELVFRGYTFYILEPSGGASLTHTDLPEKSAFIFGHEEYGISFNKDDYHGLQTLTIPQFGQVECLNVSIAASLVMYEYIRQRTDLPVQLGVEK